MVFGWLILGADEERLVTMHTRFEVRARTGELLGIFPAPIEDHAEAVRALIADNPGADVKPAISIDDPCPEHPAYEASNCPVCAQGSSPH